MNVPGSLRERLGGWAVRWLDCVALQGYGRGNIHVAQLYTPSLLPTAFFSALASPLLSWRLRRRPRCLTSFGMKNEK